MVLTVRGQRAEEIVRSGRLSSGLPAYHRRSAGGCDSIDLSVHLAWKSLGLLFKRANGQESADGGAGYASATEIKPFLFFDRFGQLAEHFSLRVA
jgi:hypothetical protein